MTSECEYNIVSKLFSGIRLLWLELGPSIHYLCLLVKLVWCSVLQFPYLYNRYAIDNESTY